MKEHVDGYAKKNRTISNSPKASKQMFSHVDNRMAIQRAIKNVKNINDLSSLTFEQLSFFESQRIRKETFGQYMNTWGNAIVIKDDENPYIWSDIERKYSTERIGNDPVLYELMTETASATHKFIYPGLDSCLGITITKKNGNLKRGAHLVQPYDKTSLKKYLEQLEQLHTFFVEGDEVQIACKNDSDIEGHKNGILDIKKFETSLTKDVDRAVEILTMLSSHNSKKEAKVEETSDVAIKYNEKTIHIAS